MKKTLFAVVLIFAVLLVCAGCADKDPEAKLVGTWSVNYDGYTYTFVFRTDHTGVATIAQGSNSMDINFSWVLDGTTVRFTVDENSGIVLSDLTFNGTTLSGTDGINGTTIAFTKQ
ncbi:MAG: hypothetical protein J5647_11590 [Spirochaetaceae bacterium]|nr:hypothetical protein [Spirochaetaceae bacterium]